MTRPTDISEEIWERADILRDQFQDVKDDTEFVARILMAVGQSQPKPKRGGLTAHQRDALGFISEYIANNDTSPSIDEIRQHFGLASKSGAHRVVGELIQRGVIAALPNKARSITIVARA